MNRFCIALISAVLIGLTGCDDSGPAEPAVLTEDQKREQEAQIKNVENAERQHRSQNR